MWAGPELSRQTRVMRTGAGVLAGMALGLIWLLFVSGLRWRARLGWLAAGLVLAGAGLGLFRFEGVTGDLVPIFRARWGPGTESSGGGSGKGKEESTRAGGDFPQFLGAQRDGEVRGVRLGTNWVARAPVLLWRQGVGEGWGGFAVVGERALTQEQAGEEEVVVCYEATTGRRIWEHRDQGRYDNPIGGIGPRATPTVTGGRVYAVGAKGQLNCLDLETGRRVWGTNVVTLAGAGLPEWGISGSPLVMGGRVIVAPGGTGPEGGTLMALDAATGARVWVGGRASVHYSSPRLETVLGVRQIFTFTGSGAAGHDAESGAPLWEQPWRGGHPHVMDPRLVGTNRVLISSGYGTGSRLIELERGGETGWKVGREVWRSIRLKAKFANVLLRDGFAYGLDDGMLVCLDLADGTRRWEGERYGHGQALLVGDWILVTAESGEVVLVRASPGSFEVAARFRALDGKTWNPPALAGNLLVVRNAHEAAAYRLPTEP